MNNTTEDFQLYAISLVKKLAQYIDANREAKKEVLIQRSPNTILQDLDLIRYIKGEGFSQEQFDQVIEVYLENTQRMHHPHYVGHQVAVPHLASSLADLLHGAINNPMGIYEMGPAAATLEQFVVNWMLEKIGWQGSRKINEVDNTDFHQQGAGILTHGGSMANLTALLAARAKAQPEAWEQGASKDLIVLAPSVSHYCIKRSVAIMGLGTSALIPVGVTAEERMDPDSLQRIYTEQIQRGKSVMAVVANACATSTGFYDPLEEIGQFCQENKIWFHVDGAHGASVLLSEKLKPISKGIELADSMIWDAHKMLRTSALCAAVLVKNANDLFNTFRQQGSYIIHDEDIIGYDLLKHTLECTKSALGTKLALVLAAEGEKGVSNFIERQHSLTKDFFQLIEESKSFESLAAPESNILCFRYVGDDKGDAFQLALRKKMIENGTFYITSCIVNEKRYLRVVLMNELTNREHLVKLLDKIEFIASKMN